MSIGTTSLNRNGMWLNDRRFPMRNRGQWRDFTRWYAAMANKAQTDPITREFLLDHLVEHASDERNLRRAWAHLEVYGGSAPGPDGVRVLDFDEVGVWELLRRLRDTLRAGAYQPGAPRVRKISKGPGRSLRKIMISNLADRVVARGITQVLGPLLDPGFDPHSYGCRPGRDRAKALADVIACSEATGRRLFVKQDLRDAFDSVPLNRLRARLAYLLPDRARRLLIDPLLDIRQRGLQQGSPLSPLLMNVYLDHVLDTPWAQTGRGAPLVRVVDDLLILCSTPVEARQALKWLRHRTTPHGLSLKYTDEAAFRDVSCQPLDWLGYRIRATSQGFRVEVTEQSWENLSLALDRSHCKPEAPLRAVSVIRGWIQQAGPAHPGDEVPVAESLERVRQLAKASGFTEIPPATALRAEWDGARARWQLALGQARQSYESAKLAKVG